MEGVLFTKATISIDEAVNILRDPHVSTVSHPLLKAKGGQAFVYKAEDASKQGRQKMHLCLFSLTDVNDKAMRSSMLMFLI